MKKKYVVNQDFLTQKDQHTLTIFNPESSKLYTLNKVATTIFKKIKSGSSEEDIQRYLLRIYEIDPDMLAKDIHSTIKYLTKNSIISLRDT